jgi:maltose-binding protein MalE
MTPRPMIVSYQELSTILQTQLTNALAGKATPEAALTAAATAAARVR